MKKQIHLLLVDDDKNDRLFFYKVLRGLSFDARLTTLDNGEKLMSFLSENFKPLPDVLFLDMNMPRKKGVDCLTEIKRNGNLASLPVIIYSSAVNDDVADLLYEKGAHYYVPKGDLDELRKVLHFVLTQISQRKFVRPEKENFTFAPVSV
jgi:CheY-like chemotaxis protein